VVNILVPQVVLDAARIDAIVGELLATGMAQHVRMDLEREASLDAQPYDHPTKAANGERRARTLSYSSLAGRASLATHEPPGH
jgi:hypothetical protein